MIVKIAPPEHNSWLVERVGYAPTAHLKCIEAISRQDYLIVGMVGFDNWMTNSVEMHFAVDRPAALRSLINVAFKFAFQQCGREYIIGLTPASREKILSWRERIGFKEIHRLKDGFAKGDDLVYSVLHRDDCRWLRKDR